MNISIIGGGSFGTALAQVFCDNGHETLIREINEEFVEKINKCHLHPFFNVSIPSAIKATLSLDETLKFSDIVILCVPTKVMRTVIKEIKEYIDSPKLFVNVSKGIEPGTSKLVSEILEEELSTKYIKGFVVVSGPSFADEIISRKATTLVSASENERDAQLLQTLLTNNSYMRVYTSSDMIGVEVCGAVKNAIALAAGISEGLKMGVNARAAIITRGNNEIVRLVEVMNGKRETCYGLAGIGDLLLTASSTQSRNFRAGFRIGQGESLQSVLENSLNVVEGVRAVEAAHEIATKHNLELPIIDMLHKVLYENYPIKKVIKALLIRDLKSE